MKLIEAIQKVNDLKRNTYDQQHKVEWLSRLDSMVCPTAPNSCRKR